MWSLFPDISALVKSPCDLPGKFAAQLACSVKASFSSVNQWCWCTCPKQVINKLKGLEEKKKNSVLRWYVQERRGSYWVALLWSLQINIWPLGTANPPEHLQRPCQRPPCPWLCCQALPSSMFWLKALLDLKLKRQRSKNIYTVYISDVCWMNINRSWSQFNVNKVFSVHEQSGRNESWVIFPSGWSRHAGIFTEMKIMTYIRHSRQ